MILECKQAFSIEIFEECYDHDNDKQYRGLIQQRVCNLTESLS